MTAHKFVFIHKRIASVRFEVHATRYYEAIELLEGILGSEKHWLHDYLVLSNGRQVGYLVAA